MTAPKILALSGSIRDGSINTRLVDAATAELVQHECEVTRISLADYPLPIYDGDLESQDGIPENAKKLARLFHEHDGLFIASPEYNGSLSPLLKNTIDWVSRVSSDEKGDLVPYRGKIGAVAAASPGGMGGISMLYHLREILTRLGVLLVAEQVAVGNGFSAFDDMDKLTDERSAQFLEATCKSLAQKAALLNR
ncbi:MAG: NAD(P)H-dependent oxidoreductase [Rhizobiaceae bacterium]|nr:NAD(P)H-dependent oxidoreductase [Rhizobiaceae bacterium]